MNYMNGKINKNKVRKLNLYLCCLVALMLVVACENEMEKPNKFDPFGQKELTLLATI